MAFVLEPDEVIVERLDKPGWAVASDEGVTVALDTALDDELRREGRVYELIHQVNTHAQGGRPRPVRPDRAVAARAPTRTCSATGTGSRPRCSRDSVELGPSDQVAFERV